MHECLVPQIDIRDIRVTDNSSQCLIENLHQINMGKNCGQELIFHDRTYLDIKSHNKWYTIFDSIDTFTGYLGFFQSRDSRPLLRYWTV